MFEGIDLFSDTMTRPTAAMKKAMVEAALGDEQRAEDPTTVELQNRVAELLGKESALFFPSATMANQVAILTQCARGDEVIAAENAHIFIAEGGGPAIFSGVMARPIPTRTGIFGEEEVRARYSPAGQGPHHPCTRLVAMENTTNYGGGQAWPLAKLESVWKTCRELKVSVHLDGSRFFNAVAATGATPRALAAGFDTLTLCLSKGLGCAAGAVLVFPSRYAETIRLWKQRMGGSLRQSGILAAAGLYAIDHHLERLGEDHANARKLAEGLAAIRGLSVEEAPSRTNMVFFGLKSGQMTEDQWNQACEKKGFRFSVMGPNRFRAVTHLDITAKNIDHVLRGVREITAEW